MKRTGVRGQVKEVREDERQGDGEKERVINVENREKERASSMFTIC